MTDYPIVPAGSLSHYEPRGYLAFVQGCTIFLASALLVYCTYYSPIIPGLQWGAWVTMNAVLLFVAPMAIMYCFLGEGPRQFGFCLGDWKRSLCWAAALFFGVLPFLLFASRLPNFQAFYPQYPPARYSAQAFVFLAWTSVVYMFCWEYFFRGWMLFGLQRCFGSVPAVILQTLVFGAAHYSKPTQEMISSFAAGIILGIICLRCRTFLPSFLVHAVANVLFPLLVIWHTGTWL